MENNKTNVTQKTKKNNPMKKLGKSIKDTFIEMSNSLAGWIDDTGKQFSGKKNHKKNQTNSTQAKFVSNPPKSNS
ncbi:MAG: hypothetical protein MJ054_02225 [Clostridia bacterium]|nr:hypothetical protein [Clostridia bacterium]